MATGADRRRRRHLNEILMYLHQPSFTTASDLQSCHTSTSNLDTHRNNRKIGAISTVSRGSLVPMGVGCSSDFGSNFANSFFPLSATPNLSFNGESQWAGPLRNNKKSASVDDSISSLTAAELQELGSICNAPCPIVVKKFQIASAYSGACTELYNAYK